MAPSVNETFLNPDTYLNHLSPADGRQFEISRNVFLVVFGAIVWDILVHLPDDLQIMRCSPFRFTTFSFIFSRLFAAAHILCSVTGRTMPIDNPHALSLVGGCLCALSISRSAFLFLQRVHAVYADSRPVQRLFSFLWVIYAGSTVTLLIGVVPAFIPGTHYFHESIIQPYIVVSALSSFLFDSCVFLAISHKIASTHSSLDERIGWATLVSGKALPRLSRAVLQGGQLYYLITVGATILAGISLLLPPPFPGTLKSTFTIPVVPLVASMACRIFRNVKLFDFNGASACPISAIEFAQATSPTVLPQCQSAHPSEPPSSLTTAVPSSPKTLKLCGSGLQA